MMVIKHLSSAVDLEQGMSQHSMVVGLLDNEGGLEVPIDAVTYGNLVGAFEQLHLAAQAEPYGTQRPYVEPEPPVTAEDVRHQVEAHLGHQLAPGPVPQEEADAEAQLRQLERGHAGAGSEAEELLKSVGFFGDEDGELDALAVSGVDDDDEPDPGEDYEKDDGVEAY